MNRRILAAAVCYLLALSACGGCYAVRVEYDDPYDPQAAVAYSYAYVSARNPEYPDFDSNCTNYISQCLVAGGKQMDEPIPPRQDVRVVYHDEANAWFCTSIHTNEKRWKEFSVSTSFCRTEDFVDYWTNMRGMEYSVYTNSVGGLSSLYEQAQAGDIVTLYDREGHIDHLCMIAMRGDMQILLNANTYDLLERSLLNVPTYTYPQVGLLKMR